MTKTEHKKRHLELHRALDELFADYIEHHPDQHGFLEMPLKKLIDWSYDQTQNPIPSPNETNKPIQPARTLCSCGKQ
jgi:hypothetical protein